MKTTSTGEVARFALKLLSLIPRRRKISAQELCDQLSEAGFPRDVRTIQRHLAELSADFDIDRDDEHKPYGYRWHDEAKALAIAHLTPQESLLLELAKQQLRSLLPPQVVRGLEGLFTQASRSLASDKFAAPEQAWVRKVRVVADGQPLLPPKVDPEVFETVSSALFDDHWLHLNYCNATGQQSEITVMPLGLAQQGVRLYLVCRYEGYANERSLALHRILSAKASDFTFDRPKEFDFEKYVAEGRFGFGEGKKVRLIFTISRHAGEHLRETPLSTDQTIRENGEFYDVEATVVDSGMLERWLLGFGNDITHVMRTHL